MHVQRHHTVEWDMLEQWLSGACRQALFLSIGNEGGLFGHKFAPHCTDGSAGANHQNKYCHTKTWYAFARACCIGKNQQ